MSERRDANEYEPGALESSHGPRAMPGVHPLVLMSAVLVGVGACSEASPSRALDDAEADVRRDAPVDARRDALFVPPDGRAPDQDATGSLGDATPPPDGAIPSMDASSACVCRGDEPLTVVDTDSLVVDPLALRYGQFYRVADPCFVAGDWWVCGVRYFEFWVTYESGQRYRMSERPGESAPQDDSWTPYAWFEAARLGRATLLEWVTGEDPDTPLYERTLEIQFVEP